VAGFGNHEFRVAAIYGDSSDGAILANIFAAFAAICAGATTPKNPRHSDSLIQEFFGYHFSYFYDAADNFVSGSERTLDELRECGPVSADEMQIGMADAARLHLQKDFAFLGNWTRNIFDYKWLAEFVKDCCAHQIPLYSIYVTRVTSQKFIKAANYFREWRRAYREGNFWNEGCVQFASGADLYVMLDVRVREFLASVRKSFNFLLSGDSAPE